MLVEHSVDLKAPLDDAIRQLEDIPRRELAEIAGAATSSGEALLQQSGMSRLDEACQCHFGAQFGRPWSKAGTTTFPLRWWNDKSRSLTPGFIGEIRLRAVRPRLTQLSIVGQYHPRAHLYELVSPAFLTRMGSAVVLSFASQLERRLAVPVAA